MTITTELAALIRGISATLEKGSKDSIRDTVKPLRFHTAPGWHEGRGAEMDHTDAGYRMQLEWFAGQLLAMVDAQSWFAINTWINCTDKFTTRKEA